MGAELDSLLAALKRLELEFRSRRRKKRPRRPGTPSNSGAGANKGCGTGKGGFSAGNSCAKEDGIPNAPRRPPSALGPVNAKADLAKAKAMKEKSAKKQAEKVAAAKAKSEAYKKTPEYAQKQKQKRIDALRRKAAERKKEKGERDAAEKKAAQEAADKKRAALLQKIRIKKANERLEVVEKPASPFSGKGDESAVRRDGELTTEFLKRKYQKDLDAYHSEAVKIETKYEKRISDASKERDDAYAEYRANGSVPALNRHNDAKRLVEEIEAKRDSELHDLVGEFTMAHAGALARTQSLRSSFSFAASKSLKSDVNTDPAKEDIAKAWDWLARVAARKHESRILSATIKLRRGGGGSHNAMNGKNEIEIGIDDTRPGTRKTAVHEYGHAIESANQGTLRSLTEDYNSRAMNYLASNKGARFKVLKDAPQYEAVHRPGEKVDDYDIQAPSYLGYARRYSDAGFKKSLIAKYRNHPDSARVDKGTEVFSTGIESIYREPSAFRRRARHGFDVSLLILAGLL